jgi:hypothetical protein
VQPLSRVTPLVDPGELAEHRCVVRDKRRIEKNSILVQAVHHADPACRQDAWGSDAGSTTRKFQIFP